jgi:hypothetical protein
MGVHFCNIKGPVPTQWVISCKLCRRNVPAGVDAFPRNNIVVRCPLCAELRRYRPSKVYLGWYDSLVMEQLSTRRHRP